MARHQQHPQRPATLYRRSTLAIAATSCAIAATLALLLPWKERPKELLTQRFRERLSTASPDETAELLHQLVRLGDPALPLLVETASDEDPHKAVIASRLLDKQVARWNQEPTKARLLASLLAQHAERGDYDARRRRANLATRLLLDQGRGANAGNSQFLSDCEQVIRAETRVVVTDAPTYPSSAAVAPFPQKPRVESDDSINPTTPSDDPDDAHTFISVNRGGGPDPLADRSSGTAEITDGDPTTAQGGARWVEPRLLAREPREPIQDVLPLTDRADREVMQLLLDTEPQTVEEAAAELRERGYQETHLGLARLLVNPDANVRLALVDALPRVRGIDPRPWLLWLTRDTDATVRKAALAVIATSNDPSLRSQLQAREQEESDPEVLRFLRRLFEDERAR